MKYAYIVALLAIFAVPANAQNRHEMETRQTPDGGALIILTPEFNKMCKAQGECVILTVEALMQFVEKGAKQMCGPKGPSI